MVERKVPPRPIDAGDDYPPKVHIGMCPEYREFRNTSSHPLLIFYGLGRSAMILPGERFIHMPFGNPGTKVEPMA